MRNIRVIMNEKSAAAAARYLNKLIEMEKFDLCYVWHHTHLHLPISTFITALIDVPYTFDELPDCRTSPSFIDEINNHFHTPASNFNNCPPQDEWCCCHSR
jgi:hypothetical protein